MSALSILACKRACRGLGAAAVLSLMTVSTAAFAAAGPQPQRIPLPGPAYEQTTNALETTREERCKIFEKRFDAAEESRGDAPMIDAARALRIEGGALCDGGEASNGIHKLREALARIGVDNRL